MCSIDAMEGIKMGIKMGGACDQQPWVCRWYSNNCRIQESTATTDGYDSGRKWSNLKGLFLNSAKSFTMMFTKSEMRHTCKITVHSNTIEQVDRYVFLGSRFTSDGSCVQDVRQWIAIAKSAFTLFEKALKNRNINIQVRCRFLRCYVWSTLVYGSEAWKLSSKKWNKLEATEMWFLRRMHRISYTEHVINVEVLRRANTKRKQLRERVNKQVSFSNTSCARKRLKTW